MLHRQLKKTRRHGWNREYVSSGSITSNWIVMNRSYLLITQHGALLANALCSLSLSVCPTYTHAEYLCCYWHYPLCHRWQSLPRWLWLHLSCYLLSLVCLLSLPRSSFLMEVTARRYEVISSFLFFFFLPLPFLASHFMCVSPWHSKGIPAQLPGQHFASLCKLYV